MPMTREASATRGSSSAGHAADRLPLAWPATRDERRSALNAIYGQLTSAAITYHSIVISLNVMLVTANIFMTGQLMGLAAEGHMGMRLPMCAIPLLIAIAGIIGTRIIRLQYLRIASLIRRIDEANGVFEPGLYLPFQSLYPETWRTFGTKRWHEIEFDLFLPLQAFFGVVSAGLILLR